MVKTNVQSIHKMLYEKQYEVLSSHLLVSLGLYFTDLGSLYRPIGTTITM